MWFANHSNVVDGRDWIHFTREKTSNRFTSLCCCFIFFYLAPNVARARSLIHSNSFHVPQMFIDDDSFDFSLETGVTVVDTLFRWFILRLQYFIAQWQRIHVSAVHVTSSVVWSSDHSHQHTNFSGVFLNRISTKMKWIPFQCVFAFFVLFGTRSRTTFCKSIIKLHTKSVCPNRPTDFAHSLTIFSFNLFRWYFSLVFYFSFGF